jgi:hypothetical protein
MGIFDHLESDLDDGARRGEADISEGPDNAGRFVNAIAARQFMRGGKATVTLVSVKTGRHYTYRIVRARDRETGEPTADGTFFVGLLTGPDNETAYSYLGHISRDVFWTGRKYPRPGDVGPDAPASKAFAWSWQKLAAGILPDQLHVYHEGRCGRCGRKLTVPESIESGFGPECIHHV